MIHHTVCRGNRVPGDKWSCETEVREGGGSGGWGPRGKKTAGGRRERCQCRRDQKGQGDLEKGLASEETVLGLKVGGWKKARDQLRSLVNRDNS